MLKSFATSLLVTSSQALSVDEQFLKPYVAELVHWRSSEIPALSRIVDLTGLTGFIPSWLENTFIPLFLPDGKTMDLALNVTLPNLPVVGDMPVSTHNVTLRHFGNLQTAVVGLVPNTEFTWRANIALDGLSIGASAWMSLYDIPFESNINMSFANMSLDVDIIAALNRTKICDVWGDVFLSSASCLLWPVMEGNNVTGMKLTKLELNLDDFQLQMTLDNPDMIPSAKKALEQQLLQTVELMKPELLANLSTKYSQMALEMGNSALLKQIPKMHAESPCGPDKTAPIMNVSRVCITNNGGYTLGFGYHDCPAHAISDQTSRFPIDQSRCTDVQQFLPEAQEGEVVRVATDAAAGLREIVDPAFRYVPNSNVAGFQCSGGTLTYNCALVSLVPQDPSILPPVSRVCVTNHAGFVMDYQLKNLRTQSWVAQSSSYPINQMKCLDLSSTAGVLEEDEFKIKVHAYLGKQNPTDRNVKYANNGLTAAFECTGTTLNFKCKLLVGASADQVERVV